MHRRRFIQSGASNTPTCSRPVACRLDCDRPAHTSAWPGRPPTEDGSRHPARASVWPQSSAPRGRAPARKACQKSRPARREAGCAPGRASPCDRRSTPVFQRGLGRRRFAEQPPVDACSSSRTILKRVTPPRASCRAPVTGKRSRPDSWVRVLIVLGSKRSKRAWNRRAV
jgi:hypothetical protein